MILQRNYNILNHDLCKQIENNGESFWCQHGNDECVGNMIQSCGLYALAGDSIRKTSFIACQMSLDADRTGQTVGKRTCCYHTSSTQFFLSQCAEANGVDFSDITRCVNGGLGLLLQIEAERITHQHRKPYPEYVPTVVFNNVSSNVLTVKKSGISIGNLLLVVHYLYPNTKKQFRYLPTVIQY